jgi:hypothetical protein
VRLGASRWRQNDVAVRIEFQFSLDIGRKLGATRITVAVGPLLRIFWIANAKGERVCQDFATLLFLIKNVGTLENAMLAKLAVESIATATHCWVAI